MAIPVIGLGAGGHAKVVIEILQLADRYELAGLLDPKSDLWGTTVLGVPVLGGDEQLALLKARGLAHFFVGLGGVADLRPRRRLYELALSHGLSPVAAIHPQAVISPSARLDRGVTVMALAVVNAAAQIGEHVIINTGAVVEHDCVIGAHAHLATGASLAGGVIVGEGTLIGAGAVVRQGIHLGRSVLVGAGAVVVKDVPDVQVVVGNPARPLGGGGDG